MQHRREFSPEPLTLPVTDRHALAMFETASELASLDALMAGHSIRAGDHLSSIISADRRLSPPTSLAISWA